MKLSRLLVILVFSVCSCGLVFGQALTYKDVGLDALQTVTPRLDLLEKKIVSLETQVDTYKTWNADLQKRIQEQQEEKRRLQIRCLVLGGVSMAAVTSLACLVTKEMGLW